MENCTVVQHQKCLVSGRKRNTNFNSVLRETYNMLSAEWEILWKTFGMTKKNQKKRVEEKLEVEVRTVM